MSFTKIFCYLFVALSAILFLSCKNNIIDPKEEQPGRRDYIWKVDTLDMPKNIVNDIWGASENDIWAIGEMGLDLDKIAHYNGNSWTRYTKELILCDEGTIFGFDRNEAWFGSGPGGQRGAFIWKWNGVTWSQNFQYDIGAYVSMFTDIYGNSKNDIFACGLHLFKDPGGSKGFVLHYDGSSWKQIFLAKNNSQFFKIRTVDDRVILTMYYGSNLDSISICELLSNSIYPIYTNSTLSIIEVDFEIITNELYLMINEDIYKDSNQKFKKVLRVGFPNFGYRFWGRCENDIFLRMKDGIAHYNGQDIQYLYKAPINNIDIRANNLIFEKDVFFCLQQDTEGKLLNMVLHGSLNE